MVPRGSETSTLEELKFRLRGFPLLLQTQSPEWAVAKLLVRDVLAILDDVNANRDPALTQRLKSLKSLETRRAGDEQRGALEGESTRKEEA